MNSCNANSNLNKSRASAQVNFNLTKKYVNRLSSRRICKIYTRCSKSSSLPPMELSKYKGSLMMIDKRSPFNARDYSKLFGDNTISELKSLAKKTQIINIEGRTKKELKVKILRKLKSKKLVEPIRLTQTIIKQNIFENENINNGINNNNNGPKTNNNNTRNNNNNNNGPKTNNNNTRNNNNNNNGPKTNNNNNNNNRNNNIRAKPSTLPPLIGNISPFVRYPLRTPTNDEIRERQMRLNRKREAAASKKLLNKQRQANNTIFRKQQRNLKKQNRKNINRINKNMKLQKKQNQIENARRRKENALQQKDNIKRERELNSELIKETSDPRPEPSPAPAPTPKRPRNNNNNNNNNGPTPTPKRPRNNNNNGPTPTPKRPRTDNNNGPTPTPKRPRTNNNNDNNTKPIAKRKKDNDDSDEAKQILETLKKINDRL